MSDKRFMISAHAIVENSEDHKAVYEHFSNSVAELKDNYTSGLSSTMLEKVEDDVEEEKRVADLAYDAMVSAGIHGSTAQTVLYALRHAGITLEAPL